MLDFSWSHILIVLIVALVVVGPKDLPRLMRIVGQWMGKARAMADQFRKSFDDMARQSELDELRKEIEGLRSERRCPTRADINRHRSCPRSRCPAARARTPRAEIIADRNRAAPPCRSSREPDSSRRRLNPALNHERRPTDDEAAIDATKAPLMDHLIELRQRLIWSIVAFVVCFLVCFYFAKPIYGFPHQFRSIRR